METEDVGESHEALRRALRARYGPGNFRIQSDGVIEVKSSNASWKRIGNANGRLVGRPLEVNGRKLTIYMDAATVKRARELGNGNISLGVRRACEIATL